jgi:SAM-dependent methyltransferase
MISAYEMASLISLPILPALYRIVRRDLKRLSRDQLVPGSLPAVLDVGGRSSIYTAGLRASVTVLDLPRTTTIQKNLNLGLTPEKARLLEERRSNVGKVVLTDFLTAGPELGQFDGVIAVEVIEHIEDDKAFFQNVLKVLKPGGFVYLTTPNGDYVRNEGSDFNPDHKRHYRLKELETMMAAFLDSVHVRYGIKTGRYRFRGLRGLSLRSPIQSIVAGANNVISQLETNLWGSRMDRTAHLLASGIKRSTCL